MEEIGTTHQQVIASSAADFGRYLQSVAERDIDLLLMEEFHITPTFAAWFSERAGLSVNSVFDGAWHSLNDQNGETDLLLRVKIGKERVAILIENKISAPEQDKQAARYAIRGMSLQEAGRYDRFVTCICAPQIYLNSLPLTSVYQNKVAYEAIRDWFSLQEGRRSAWRHAIMNEAIEQGRRGYTMKVHAGKTAFHRDFWEYIQRNYPLFIMKMPGPKGPKSDWIRFKTATFPKGVTLNFKNDQECMDLELERTTAIELERRRKTDWPTEVRILTRGQSAALSIIIPRCNMDLPAAQQFDRIEAALAAAHKLIPLAWVMQGPNS